MLSTSRHFDESKYSEKVHTVALGRACHPLTSEAFEPVATYTSTSVLVARSHVWTAWWMMWFIVWERSGHVAPNEIIIKIYLCPWYIYRAYMQRTFNTYTTKNIKFRLFNWRQLNVDAHASPVYYGLQWHLLWEQIPLLLHLLGQTSRDIPSVTLFCDEIVNTDMNIGEKRTGHHMHRIINL